MILDVAIFTVGLIFLAFGAKKTIEYAAALAEILGLDKYGIGAGILATITSLPELAVAIFAILSGEPNVVVGTAFGSVVGLFLLSLGFIGILASVTFPKEREKEVVRAVTIVLFVTILALVLRKFPWYLGLILFAAYFWYVKGLHEGAPKNLRSGKHNGALTTLLKLAVSVILVLLGAKLVVSGTVSLAEHFGVSPFIVAFVVVAIGTNLPELTVEVSAAFTGNTDIAVGDILGSAVADLTLVLGTAAVLGGLTGHDLVFNGGLT